MSITDGLASVLVTLAAAAIVGLVGGLIHIWRDHYAHKLHVAENYLKRDGIIELKDEVKSLRGVVFRIAGKMGIPLTGEE